MTQNPRHIVISDEEHALPYSKGLMASSIMATGLPPARAFHVAERIEERLHERGVPSITRAALARTGQRGARGRGRAALRRLLRQVAGREPDRPAARSS